MEAFILEEKKPLIPKLAQDLIAGTVGGWAQVVVGHPADTIKVRLQTQPSPPIYNGAMDCIRKLVKEEGVQGLYRGVTSPLAGIGFCNAIMFMANGWSRRILQNGDDKKTLSIFEIGVAGSFAGTVMAFLNCPIELLKVKLQTQDPKGFINAQGRHEPAYRGVLDCGIRTVRAQGFMGIYRGMGVTLLRDTPSYFSYFVAYEGLKRLFQNMKKDGELGNFELLMAGGLSGFAAWIPAYPQDVIKSNYQNDIRYKSLGQVVKTLYRSAGPKAFVNGLGPTLVRAFPANAATFYAYEMAMDVMKRF
ncbi:mitochondrial carrier domain-containing protein [Cokeromyces recurvatus]|uniref:mitochondrial carrier domain-containing protein n=1 Tax=Cokeromyces recurvatus TaxID=90255 RepID=UPI00221F0CC0|nr:mitochondrial carrier domain-containing protein [Cokeromyces recurvatus]KAI7903338.1 mitochondrial carrier domain-containing protein [Cokeromyces recurvatus]